MVAELLHADGRKDGETDGNTVRHDESNSRFSQLSKRAY